MRYIKLFWHSMLAEPFYWMFVCFFQPTRFKREYENEAFGSRFMFMARLALPTFLISFPFALLVRTLFYTVYQGSVDSSFLLGTAIATSLGIVLGSILCLTMGSAWGITSDIAFGSFWGIVLATLWDIKSDPITIQGICIASIAGVLVGSIAGFITGRKGLGIGLGAVQGMAGGILGCFVEGVPLGIVTGIGLGVLGGIVGGLGKGVAAGTRKGFLSKIMTRIPENMAEGIGKNVITGVAAGMQVGMQIGIAGGGVLGIIGAMAYKIDPHLFSFTSTGVNFIISQGIGLGITFGIVWGITLGMALGRIWSLAGGIALSIAGGIALDITLLIAGGSVIGLAFLSGRDLVSTMNAVIGGGVALGTNGCLTFILSYILCYYRLPLYPISAFSVLKAYAASKKHPAEVFTYLRGSALYWDECVYLPLPRLRHMLQLAADQDAQRTGEEVRFIVAQQPQQIQAAQEVSLELALRDLEACVSLRDIATVSERLATILPQETKLMHPRWSSLFARLDDASRQAASACTPIGWQARSNALNEMRHILNKVCANPVFSEASFNERLNKVFTTWLMAAQAGLDAVEQASEKTGHVRNPFAPGPILQLDDSLFVGRRDLVQQLGEALSRGSRRPTFLLNGERRMGKSSTLKQLPALLGAHYLCITFDLQNPGLSSSTVAFLSSIAEEIGNTMDARGMQVRRLLYDQLREAGRENEAAVYRIFDLWLKNVERTLAKEDKMLLLAFDEFEKLAEAAQDSYFTLRLLLNWFRSVIQNSAQIALLFSGIRTFDDMSPSWAGYFVNVEGLKVGFLRPSEARQLITHPVPDFPGARIFAEEVVEKIVEVTGCHPFLVQALCSSLIDAMNVERCNCIELKDVTKAMRRVLNNWGSTYFRDLWERTDEEQQACLFALKELGKADLLSIAQQSNLDASIARYTLETLIKRDLVVLEDEWYRIAAPIFAEWVERSSYQRRPL